MNDKMEPERKDELGHNKTFEEIIIIEPPLEASKKQTTTTEEKNPINLTYLDEIIYW